MTLLVKYYGLIHDENLKREAPRYSFISDGLFRMTQPKYLNDKNECKLVPYFNRFSPADLAWAKKRYYKFHRDPSYECTDEKLINFFLKPTGRRYGDCFPSFFKDVTGYNSIEEFDKAEFDSKVKTINDNFVEILSSWFGVFSLCKTDINELLWTHYASEGKGIAVTFKQEHDFFKKYALKDVSYCPDDRATITYYKGTWRINGEPLKKFLSSDGKTPDVSKLNEQDLRMIHDRLVFSKGEIWNYEDEARILFSLSLREKIKTETKESNSILQSFFQNIAPKICLIKIPFDAFESIVFGYETSKQDKDLIIEKVNANPELAHLKLKEVRFNTYRDLETKEFSV